ncbi:hypothetical protein BGZ60DRAFT_534480 [Tricladium varicosporioides]|nr:hypothetical protein BGZ60DRAFT_534480 [Hymenoscyphus varicosporioides]
MTSIPPLQCAAGSSPLDMVRPTWVDSIQFIFARLPQKRTKDVQVIKHSAVSIWPATSTKPSLRMLQSLASRQPDLLFESSHDCFCHKSLHGLTRIESDTDLAYELQDQVENLIRREDLDLQICVCEKHAVQTINSTLTSNATAVVNTSGDNVEPPKHMEFQPPKGAWYTSNPVGDKGTTAEDILRHGLLISWDKLAELKAAIKQECSEQDLDSLNLSLKSDRQKLQKGLSEIIQSLDGPYPISRVPDQQWVTSAFRALYNKTRNKSSTAASTLQASSRPKKVPTAIFSQPMHPIDIIQSHIIDLNNDSSHLVRCFLKEFLSNKQILSSETTTSYHLDYNRWLQWVTEQTQMDCNTHELVYFSYWTETILVVTEESFRLAVQEAQISRQKNWPVLVRPFGSVEGGKQLTTAMYQPLKLVKSSPASANSSSHDIEVRCTRTMISQPNVADATDPSSVGTISQEDDIFYDAPTSPQSEFDGTNTTSNTNLVKYSSYREVREVEEPEEIAKTLSALAQEHTMREEIASVLGKRGRHENEEDEEDEEPLSAVHRHRRPLYVRSNSSPTASLSPSPLIGSATPTASDNQLGVVQPEGKIETFDPEPPPNPHLDLEHQKLLTDISNMIGSKLHQMHQGLYELTCLIFRHEGSEVDPQTKWRFNVFKKDPFGYQCSAAVFLLTRTTEANYAHVADETGLGKTVVFFLAWAVQTLYSICAQSLDDFRAGNQNSRPHLAADYKQPAKVKNYTQCPSQKHWGVPCPCAYPQMRCLEPRKMGVSLLILHAPAQLPQFRHKFHQFVDTGSHLWLTPPDLYLHHTDYVKYAMPGVQRNMICPEYDAKYDQIPYTSAKPCHFIVATTVGSYDGHVRRFFGRQIDIRGPRKRNPDLRWLAGILFSHIHVDESHKHYSSGSQIIQLLENLRCRFGVRCCTYSATPYETTTCALTNYYTAAHNPHTLRGIPADADFSQTHIQHLSQLYLRLTKGGAAVKPQDVVKAQARQKFISDWAEFLGHFVIQRFSSTEWMWSKKPIASKPPHFHQAVDVYLSDEDLEEARYIQQRAEAEATLKGQKLNIHNPLKATAAKVQFGRLHANFPRVAKYRASHKFQFTIEELKDNKWYAEEVERGPYQGEILKDILANSPKLKWVEQIWIPRVLNGVVETIEGKTTPAKGIILSTIPACVELIHKSFQLKGIAHRHLQSYMSNSQRTKMLDSFLDQGINSPRFLVASMELSGTGFDQQVSQNGVIFEPAFTLAVEKQARGRFSRVGFKNPSQSTTLFAHGHMTEARIVASQLSRSGLHDESVGLAHGQRGNPILLEEDQNESKDLDENEA